MKVLMPSRAFIVFNVKECAEEYGLEKGVLMPSRAFIVFNHGRF